MSIGFFFFINPTPLGLDLIPDVFGCVMVFAGLTQLSFFDGSIETARRFSFYLFIVEAVKLLSTRAIFLTNVSSNRLLAVTAFSIAEAFIYIVMFKQLFSGVSYFAMRNNANETLKKCDGIMFLSMLAFFIRIAATILPELTALYDILLSKNAKTELDFSEIEKIESLVSAKIILVVLLTGISLVVSIAWYSSMLKLFKTLHREMQTKLDTRYFAEYSSRPEKVRPKKLRYASYAVYVAIFFSLDFAIDGKRIIPIAAMFFGLLIASLLFKSLHEFKKTAILSSVSLLLFSATEIHHAILVPYGAIVIYETPILTVISGAVLCVLASVVGLLTVRSFLIETKKLQYEIGGSEIDISKSWFSFSALIILWCIGYVVPYFYSYVSTLRFFAAIIFIWQTAKLFVRINDEEYERYIMLK